MTRTESANEKMTQTYLRPLSSRVTAPRSVVMPAAGGDLTWRPATKADIPLLFELKRVVSASDHPRSVIMLDELENEFANPAFNLAVDSVIAFDSRNRAVAYASSYTMSGQESIVWVALDGAVHPQRRGEGIGSDLLRWQEQRGLQHLASSDKALPGWLGAGTEESDVSTVKLFHDHGYESLRWWLELDRDLADPLPQVDVDPAVRIVGYEPKWSEQTRQAFNESFRDHWGTQPVDRAQWEANDLLSSSRADLSYLAVTCSDDGAENVVAFVTTEVNEEEWGAHGYSFGYLGAVGVVREWRGRGLARALITQTLRAYQRAGFQRAVLEVDSESPTGALGLYEGLGFLTVDRSVSLVKQF